MPDPRSSRRSLSFVVLIAAVLALALPRPAVAGWTQLPQSAGPNFNEPSLLRVGKDLIVVYPTTRGVAENALIAKVTNAGVVTGPWQVLPTDWSTISNPGLVQFPDGRYAVFFGGIRSTEPGEVLNGGTAYAASSDAATWSLNPTEINDRNSYDTIDMDAAVSGDGTVWTSHSGTFGTYSHPGLVPATSFDHVSSCCGYNTSLATDLASGQTVIAWYSNQTNMGGLFWQALPGVAGMGQYMPGSAVTDATKEHALSLSGRVPLAARAGGGIYTAYGIGWPTYTSVRVLKLGGSFTTIPGTSGATDVSVAAGAAGRMWVMWYGGSGYAWASRSNTAVTAWSTPTPVKIPNKDNPWRLLGDGAAGPSLNLFAHLPTGGDSTWTTVVFPTLTLTAKPKKVTAGEMSTVTFKVRDAGVPVNAKVKFRGVTTSTGPDGNLDVTFTAAAKPKKLGAVANASGYLPGATSIKVKRS